jgi:hypothetical protein
MLEANRYQDALEIDSDSSEAIDFANAVFGSGQGCGDFARPAAR